MKKFYLTLCFLVFLSNSLAQTVVSTKIFSQGAGPGGKVAIKIHLPSAGRYTGNLAPVVVYIPGSNDKDGITPFPPEQHLALLGFIEIQLNFPGGTNSDGIYDNRGSFCLSSLKDIIRFASGLKPDTAGKTLSMYANPIVPMNNNVGIIGISNGGNAALATSGLYADSIPNLAWILNWESPVGDGMPDIGAGAYNTGGNPILNPAYNDTTGIFNFSSLKWIDTVSIGNNLHGGFYFDINNNSLVDWGVDYVIRPYTVITQWGQKAFSSVASVMYAYNNGIYPSSPPPHLPDSIQTKAFWHWRNGEYWIDSVVNKMPQLMFMVIGTDTDHAQAAHDHPHVLLQYEKFRSAGARFVRLNPDRSYVEYILGTPAPIATDNPAFTICNHLTIRNAMEPDNSLLKNILNKDSILIAAGACELADRTFYNDTSANINNILTNNTDFFVENNFDILIYPNPFSETATLKISNWKNQSFELKIFDVFGKTVFQSEIKNQKSLILNLNLPNGIYFLQVKGNNFIQTKKMEVIK
jgi:hypothetical protein